MKGLKFYSTGLLTIATCFFVTTGASAAGIDTFNLPVMSPWYDTGIDVLAGGQISITASGNITFGYSTGQYANANGVGPLYDGTLFESIAALPNAVVLSVIGKIGGNTTIGTGTLLTEGTSGKGAGFVGASYDQIANASGRLFLGYNDELYNYGDNSGSFSVSVVIVPEPAVAAIIGLAGIGSLINRQRKRTT